MSSADYKRDLRMSSYLNRTLCDVLSEMRKCFETYNFAPMASLIEEAQIMGNRMEAKLEELKDNSTLTDLRKQIKEDIKKLQELENKTDHEVKHTTEKE